MINNRFLCILIVLFVYSCDVVDVDYENIKGQWIIEEIQYNNKHYEKYLLSNVLIFKNNNKIFIPVTHSFINDDIPLWNLILIQNNKYIEIKTSNLVFKGLFQFNYFNNNSKSDFVLELKSESTYIKAHKLLSYVN